MNPLFSEKCIGNSVIPFLQKFKNSKPCGIRINEISKNENNNVQYIFVRLPGPYDSAANSAAIMIGISAAIVITYGFMDEFTIGIGYCR